MYKGALISKDGLYRYILTRVWNDNLEQVVFVMLNPSTADAEDDDPTIRKCIALAKSWGYGSIKVVNLFAYRSTDAMKLKDHKLSTIIGEDNNIHVYTTCKEADLIVLAWGDSLGKCKLEAPKAILSQIPLERAHHLGLTRNGRPKHPLFLKGDVKPIKYFK